MLRRRLIRNKYSLQVSIPIDFARNLGWKQGDTLFIKPSGRQGLYMDRLFSDNPLEVKNNKRRGRPPRI